MIESWFASPVNTETHQTTSSRRSQRRLCNRLPGASHYEERYRRRVLTNLERRAKSLGYVLQEAPAPA